MTLILVGALLFIAGVVYTALQPLKGRLSRPRTVSPTPDGKTLEPERPGRGLSVRANWPGVLLMIVGGALLLWGAAGF
jgi:hypothetical protein